MRIEVGTIAGMDGEYEDWDEQGEPWGYMHLHCFYMSVGDPRAIEARNEAMRQASA